MIGSLVRCTHFGRLTLSKTVDDLISPRERRTGAYTEVGDLAVIIDLEDITETRQWETRNGQRRRCIYVLGCRGDGWTWEHHWEQV